MVIRQGLYVFFPPRDQIHIYLLHIDTSDIGFGEGLLQNSLDEEVNYKPPHIFLTHVLQAATIVLHLIRPQELLLWFFTPQHLYGLFVRDVLFIVSAVLDEFDKCLRLPGVTFLHDVKVLSAIIAHLATLARIELLTQELQLKLPPAVVWFLTVLKDGVKGMDIFILAGASVIIISHYEEIIALSITILIV